MSQESEQLDLLGIFHYVVGGMTALFSCLPFIHLAIGIALLTGKMDGPNPPPAMMGWFLISFAAFFILCGWTLAILITLTGRRLRQRRAQKFCFIIGCVECVLMPFGTVLGVFTILLLNKESVRQLFHAGA